jgi:hypothetical protein
MAFPGGAQIAVIRHGSNVPLPVMQLDFLNNTSLNSRITFSRGTGATRVNASGFIETVGNADPRFDYDPVTLAPRGLLIEEARTNILTYSDDFTNAIWLKTNATVTANVTASPDGTANADKLVETAVTGTHNTYRSMGVVTGAYTQTFYAKAAERSWIYVEPDGSSATRTYYNLVGNGSLGTIGTGVTASIVPAGNGWYKLTCTYTFAAATAWAIIGLATANGTNSYAGDGTSGLFLYGAQLEAGAFATSYIPTVASTVSRSADVATMTGTNFSTWYNQTEGTFAAQYDSYLVDTSTRNALSAYASGATSNNILLLNTVQRQFQVNNSGNQVDLDGGTPASGAIVKAAGTYKLNDFALSLDGGAVVTDTAGTVPTVDTLGIGISSLGLTPINGHIRAIAYYNTRLPNTQLQTLTAPSLASPLALDFISPTYTVGY